MTTKPVALVTGASSGIGEASAKKLLAAGYIVYGTSRRGGKAGEGLFPMLELDVTDDASVEAAVNELMRREGRIDLLVNNAGFGAVAPLLQSDIKDMVSMIDINVTALTRLTYAALPAFVKQGSGTLINIASIVAVGPEILNGVYGATKAYVLALTQSLQHELAAQGIRVQAVLPGATATDFWDVAGLPHQHLPSEIVMSTADMVDAALAGLDAGEVITIPPLQDGTEWDAYEATRKALSQRFGHTKPGQRYLNK